MDKGRIGIQVQMPTPAATVEMIVHAEDLGVPTVWLTCGGAGPDALTLIAAAATRTETIRLGTAIVPTFPRHPLVMVQQAEVIANLMPGRFVLGVGTSNQGIIERTFAIPYERPLEHLREYVTIIKEGLAKGAVDFDGVRFHAHATVPHPAEVPVMISAVRHRSFRLAGTVADGAISWCCPASYLHDVALPAMREGAARANRPTPPLVGAAFVAVSEDASEVAREARRRMAIYPRLHYYQEMFTAAGYPEAQKGEWSDAMLNAIVIHGDEAAVASGLWTFMDTSGASELVASVLPVGPDPEVTIERTMRLIASL